MVRLLGPPIARACAPRASHDWIRVNETPEGFDISVDTTRTGPCTETLTSRDPRRSGNRHRRRDPPQAAQTSTTPARADRPTRRSTAAAIPADQPEEVSAAKGTSESPAGRRAGGRGTGRSGRRGGHPATGRYAADDGTGRPFSSAALHPGGRSLRRNRDSASRRDRRTHFSGPPPSSSESGVLPLQPSHFRGACCSGCHCTDADTPAGDNRIPPGHVVAGSAVSGGQYRDSHAPIRYHGSCSLHLLGVTSDALGVIAAILLMVSWSPVADRRRAPRIARSR